MMYDVEWWVSIMLPAVLGVYPEDRGSDGETLWHLSSEGQVDKGGIVVVEVKQVDVDCGADWGMQWRPAHYKGVPEGQTLNSGPFF